ncbi:hypothetical protein QFZ67_000949 [Streptomyces sp. V1I1]|nr:hypothetical protein [Streptomyces sp. V1I1]
MLRAEPALGIGTTGGRPPPLEGQAASGLSLSGVAVRSVNDGSGLEVGITSTSTPDQAALRALRVAARMMSAYLCPLPLMVRRCVE